MSSGPKRFRHGASFVLVTFGIIFLLGVHAGVLQPSTPVLEEASTDTLVQDLIQWIQAQGAVKNPKVSLEERNGMTGMYALQDMKDGEVLVTVPWHLIVTTEDEDECDTITAIWEEMKVEDQGEEKMTPYARYLKAQPRNILPTLWTRKGQAFLKEMLGSVLQPQDVSIERHWINECDEPELPVDPLHLHAYQVVSTRSDDDLMVPFYDMINHRNGRHANTRQIVSRGELFALVTTKPVAAGEQLYVSYNQCDYCKNRLDWHGTPDMFREYGFVEDYPRRFLVYNEPNDTIRIKFDIDVDEETNELVVLPGSPPDKESVKWLKTEVVRLHAFATKYQTDTSSIREQLPIVEWEGVWRLHAAYLEAFEEYLRAVSTGEMTLSDDVWAMSRNSWYLNSMYRKYMRVKKMLAGADDVEDSDDEYEDDEEEDEEEDDDDDEEEEEEEEEEGDDDEEDDE